MEFYRFMHFSGIILIFISLGAIGCWYALGRQKSDKGFRPLAISHGVGMMLTLVGGFGMAARLGIFATPWIALKTVLWLALGGALVAARKMQNLKYVGYIAALGIVVVYCAVFKPI